MYKVQHFEYPATDPERAKKFYEDVFGWKVTSMPFGDMTYYTLHTTKTDDKGMTLEQNAINGGMYKRTKDDDIPLVYVTVDSIEDTLAKAQAGGGKALMKKTPVGDMGFMAKVEDSEGNVIGIWEMKK